MSKALKRKAAAVEPIAEVEIPEDLQPFISKYIDAFNKLCETGKISALELERFKLIFQAAKDYAQLFRQHEEIEKVKRDIAELKAIVAAAKKEPPAESQT